MKGLLLSILFLTFCSVANANITTGLVGWWRFAEGSGSTALDSSGNGNNGTENNSPSYVAGKIGSYALSFNGSNQYVNIPALSAFGTSSGATYSAWVYSKGTQSQYSSIIETRSGSNGLAGLLISGNGVSNTLTATWGGGISEYNATTGLIIPNNTWTFVVAVVTSTGITIYMNGSSYTISESLGSQALTGGWDIGEDPTIGGRFWNGYINDVRIYNRALSAADVVQLYNYNGLDYTTGLEGWWKFDEGSGSTANDSSGNGNNGTEVSSPSYVTGKIGPYALNFSGNTYVSIGSPSVLEMNNTFTWSCWFKWNSAGAGTNETLMIWQSGGNGGYFMDHCNNNGLGCNQANKLSFGRYGDEFDLLSNTTLSSGAWYLCTVTVNSSGTILMYVNGALDNSGSVTLTTPSGTLTFSDPSFPVNGIVDDVRIYNRVLSPGDVAALYEYTGQTNGFLNLNSK